MRSNPDVDKNRYRANTCSAVQRLAAASSFTVAPLDRIKGRPEVLRMTWPTYLLGAVCERRVNSWDELAMFRVLRVGELRKVWKPTLPCSNVPYIMGRELRNDHHQTFQSGI